MLDKRLTKSWFLRVISTLWKIVWGSQFLNEFMWKISKRISDKVSVQQEFRKDVNFSSALLVLYATLLYSCTKSDTDFKYYLVTIFRISLSIYISMHLSTFSLSIDKVEWQLEYSRYLHLLVHYSTKGTRCYLSDRAFSLVCIFFQHTFSSVCTISKEDKCVIIIFIIAITTLRDESLKVSPLTCSNDDLLFLLFVFVHLHVRLL